MSTPSGKPHHRFSVFGDAPENVRDQLAASNERKHGEGPEILSATPPDPIEDSYATHPESDAKSVSAASAEEDADGDTRLRAAFQDRIAAYDADLERLEAALSATRGNEVKQEPGRLPPAPQLARVQGLRLPDDVHIEGFRLPRSLEAAYVLPIPDRNGTQPRRAVLFGIFCACALAAPVAYFALSYYGAPNEPLANTHAPRVSTLEAQIASLPPMPAMQPEAAPPPLPDPPQPPAVHRYRLQRVAPSAPGDASGVAAVGESPASPAASSLSSPALPLARPAPTERPLAPTIAAEDIAMLLDQGEQLISVGDVAAARVLFERAAEAGDANAAFSLGATYDPVVLARLGVRGISPDPKKADLWYKKAQEHGSPKSPAWLAKLARR